MRNPRHGGIGSALLLTFLVIVCVAIAGGLYIARHVVHNVSVRTTDKEDGADVSIDTPAGHLNVRARDRAAVSVPGVPLYPGARPKKDSGGGAVVEWNSNEGPDKGVAVSASETITDDPASKVEAWYKDQLPSWTVTHERDGVFHMELRDGGYKRIVSIEEKHDGTHIGVASVGEPASN
jgi:hypothetical protein